MKASARFVSRAEFKIGREVKYIADYALKSHSCIVTLGPLVLFSTDTGDAWMLDPEDHLALCLAREFDPLPVHIEETLERFAVAWTHSYQIDEDLMTFIDRDGRASTLWGYPAREIQRAVQNTRT